MAQNDVIIVKSPYASLPTITCQVDDYTTSSSTQILPGEPVKLSGAEGGNVVIKCATGDPEIGTDIMMGIAASADSATSSANGTVEVFLPLPGIIYRCAATTSGNLAEGARYDTVAFDLTTSTFTVDENEGSDEDVHGLRIVDMDTDAGTVDFIIKEGVTMLGNLVA